MPFSLSAALTRVQKGQYVFEKTTTVFSARALETMDCALMVGCVFPIQVSEESWQCCCCGCEFKVCACANKNDAGDDRGGGRITDK